MHKIFGLFGIVIFASTTTIGCVSIPKVIGSGNEIRQERQVSEFDSIEIEGDLVVSLVPGKSNSIVLNGDDNLLGLVKTTVIDDTLHAKIECECQALPTSELRLVVAANSLKSIKASDSVKLNIKGVKLNDVEVELTDRAKMSMSDVNADQIGVMLSDSASIEASGKTKELFVHAEDDGVFLAEGLIAQDAEVNTADDADVKVNVVAKLDAELSGDSILRLKNEPKESNTQIGDGAEVLRQY